MSSEVLLDVNVLVALAWPTHSSHRIAQQWFARQGRHGWATCPFTQSGFVRILSNPAFVPNALAPMDALALLKEIVSGPGHHFWEADISLVQALQPFIKNIKGYRQVSDAYLLGLTVHKKGKLATLDHGVLDLLDDKDKERERIILL